MAKKSIPATTKPAIPKMDKHAAEMARRAANDKAAKIAGAAAEKKHKDEMERRAANLRKARGGGY